VGWLAEQQKPLSRMDGENGLLQIETDIESVAESVFVCSDSNYNLPAIIL
jgi:hypothetical protein